MRIGKVIIVIVSAFMVRIVLSCCDCTVPTEYQYSYDYISVYNLDNSGKEPIISLTNHIPEHAYGILIDFALRELRISKSHIESFQDASAFDCFCRDTICSPKDTISSITITTNSYFNSQFPAESDISDLFKIVGSNSYISIVDYLRKQDRVYYYYEPQNEKLDLYLLQAPENTGVFNFNVEVRTSDNRILTMTTGPVTLE
jgi:hypothetical protein